VGGPAGRARGVYSGTNAQTHGPVPVQPFAGFTASAQNTVGSLQHGWNASQDDGGVVTVPQVGPHVPALHMSVVLQQGTAAEQLWPDAAHVCTGFWQVPLVAPAGIEQVVPAQQSASTVQAPPLPMHGAAHVPALQIPEQQSVLVAQVAPLMWQVDDCWQLKPLVLFESTVHWPRQQDGSSAPVHAAPTAVQLAGAAQRRTPAASGTQGARLQHWSRNWQTLPGWMQHCGLFAVQPVGQVEDWPPKQR